MRKTFFLILVLLIFSISAKSQIFTTEQEDDIKQSTKVLLNRFVDYADLTSDGISISEIYKTEFKNIFANLDLPLIYNDLTSANNYISANEYIKIVETNYPHGIEVKMDLDSAVYQKFKKISETEYSVQVVCNKYTIGLNNSGKIRRQDIRAYLTISFKQNEKDFSDFKISEIINETTILKQKSDEKIKGFYLGYSFSPTISFIGLINNSDYYYKKNKINLSFYTGLSADYFLSTHLGFGLNLNYSIYQTDANIVYNNQSNNNLLKPDAENDKYFLYVESNIDEKISISAVELPLKFIYRFKLANETSFYLCPNLIFSFTQNSKFVVNGTSTHKAYYPNYHLLIQNAEDYNLGVVNYMNKKYSN